jgi:two-component system phosphate regulon sensor histidine kinase PhoR
MKRSIIRLIVGLTTLALVGTIVTQVFWVDNAMKLREDQFNSRTKIALKMIVNQLFRVQVDTIGANGYFCKPACNAAHSGGIGSIDEHLLDSLIHAEFACMKIEKDYVYGVYNSHNNRILMGTVGQYADELIASPHNASLSCIHRSDAFYLAVYFPHQKSMLFTELFWWVSLSLVFLLIISASYLYTVLSFLKQKRLSEMKNGFVNNMTHELKTPVSTISLASEMLMKSNVYEHPDRVMKYAAMIYGENTRLKTQIEHVLQVTVLDKDEFKLKLTQVNVVETLDSLCEGFELLVKENGGALIKEYASCDVVISADALHFVNIISNLIDNAIKYSPQKPEIRVYATKRSSGLIIGVEDKGLGINAQNQKDVFKKFYRVPTGNVHDVKGFGLGLFYVKTMVQAHGGRISLKSEPGKGSTFELFFPFSGIKKLKLPIDEA